VVNLMMGFIATLLVSLNGSPTVSPTTQASCSLVPFFSEFHFNYLFGVVPRAAGVGHEDGLVQAEGGKPDQEANEEIGFQAGKCQRG